jgi:hypothetical protein
VNNSTFLLKGLFGGLLAELKVCVEGLIDEIRNNWDCDEVGCVRDTEDWRRGGAETYIARGDLIFRDGTETSVIGKAFVGWGSLPEVQQERWEQRRAELRDAGVPVPKLYARYPGLSIEQFIPDELDIAGELEAGHAFQLGKLARVLSDRNYHPISFGRDLRLSAGIVVFVDFGSDLGGTGQSDRIWIDRARALLSPTSLSEFDRGLRQNC